MGDHAPSSDPAAAASAADEAQRPDKRSTYLISKTVSEQIPLVIVETACRAENLTLTTWSSSVVLSNTLHKLDIVLPLPAAGHGFSVLELGAGTGLSGLSGACVWRSRALLTELPEIVPGLQANIDANAAVLAAEGAGAGCGTLDWNSPTEIHLYGPSSSSSSAPTAHTIHVADEANKFPIVMAADTMYTEDHPELLTRTMAACLSRTPEARVVVCWPMRVCYLDHSREFWRLMDERGLVTVQEGQEYADFDGLDDEPLHEWCVFRWKDLA